jgi:ribosome-binding factor A
MAFRKEKLIEQIQHIAGDYLSREANKNSLITVTHVYLSDDTKEATVMVTVLPENKEKAALDFLKRKRSDFKDYFKTHSNVGRIPFFDFEIDQGQKSADRLNEISRRI